VQSVHADQLREEVWPALFTHRHLKEAELKPELVKQLWQGSWQDEYAEATVIATTAIALQLLGKADNQLQAQLLAEHMWSERNKAAL
jgi:anthranilate phosphoribosyltransferase